MYHLAFFMRLYPIKQLAMNRFTTSILALFLILNAVAQNSKTISVIDPSNNTPLEGANLSFPQQKQFFSSDKDGHITIYKWGDSPTRMRMTYVGYKTIDTVISFDNISGTIKLEKSSYQVDEVMVSSTRVKSDNPSTFNMISKAELDKLNMGQDMPVLLDNMTSVVTASDAGNGVGYTYMRVRGSDQSRINVTMNGIPYNDPESQQVYWVDMPDIASSVNDIQVQRGIGSSTNGSAAFGATVNVNTNAVHEKPYGEFSNSFGSYATIKNTLALGTGLIKNHFCLDGRFSHIRSDGYMDRASSKLMSYYLSGGYYDDNTSIRVNHFAGWEKTYQAWYGVPQDSLGTNRTYNLAGTDYGQLNPAYQNQVDNYYQAHYQLLISQQIKQHWHLNGNVFYTRGKGYYEEYKVGASLANYGFAPVITTNDTIQYSDLVRRRWLNNHFYGAHLAAEYQSVKLDWMAGASWNQYWGRHYGEVIWAQFASTIPIDNKYYQGEGLKTDFSAFTKINYKPLKNLSLFLDLQYRNIGYSINGRDNEQKDLYTSVHFNFFNPKFGITWYVKEKHRLNVYAGIGHREPTRDDYTAAIGGSRPIAEKMVDLELGYQYRNKKNHIGINLYFMGYKDQLVLTGELNDVGNPVKFNVPKSYRAGIEIEGSYTPHKIITLEANATFSMNKILAYDEVIYTYAPYYTPIDSLQLSIHHSNTNISFSPWITASGTVSIRPLKGLELGIINKLVGRQFMDNSHDKTRSINPYFLNNVLISYTLKTDIIKEIRFSLLFNNISNRKYVSNGYTYTERYAGPGYVGDPVTYNYYYPQAPFNVLGGISFRF